MVAALLLDTLDGDRSFRELLLQGIRFVVTISAAVGIYLIVVNITTRSIGLTDYEGISDMGKLSIRQLPYLIYRSYYEYISFFWKDSYNYSASVLPPDSISGESSDVHFEPYTIYYPGHFSDVPADQWYTGSVSTAYSLGLMQGVSDSLFDPYGNVTVAQAIAMAARIHSIYTNGEENFNQTSGNTWYQTYLDYAYKNGIISRAYYNSDVDQEATRAQFSEIFANALPDHALAEMNHIGNNAIPDVKSTDSFAQSVYKLYRAGILSGSDANGTFYPKTYITRAEAAAIVSRMAESDNRVQFSL